MIKEPLKRSSRWVSTSIPQSAWDSPLAQYSSAEYYANNLVSPVLFKEGLSHVPENAVVVEIAPNAVLQVRSACCYKATTHNIPISSSLNIYTPHINTLVTVSTGIKLHDVGGLC